MSKKNTTLIEYENLIEELMKENEKLKKTVFKLEKQNQLLKKRAGVVEEIPEPPEPKKAAKLSKKSKKKEISEPVIVSKEVETPAEKGEEILTESTFSPEIPAPLRSKGGVIEGTSRRECPVCGNKNKKLIREILDKTHIICDYPRMYSKKLVCGDCGQEWRVSTEV